MMKNALLTLTSEYGIIYNTFNLNLASRIGGQYYDGEA